MSDTVGITSAEDLAWVRPRLGLPPLRTKLDPLRLSDPQASRLPRTSISCTNPDAPPE